MACMGNECAFSLGTRQRMHYVAFVLKIMSARNHCWGTMSPQSDQSNSAERACSCDGCAMHKERERPNVGYRVA